jgi:hypothetical protein
MQQAIKNPQAVLPDGGHMFFSLMTTLPIGSSYLRI